MKRGGDFRETVYCFGEEEGETYTLCRWLRARKFDLAETIKMVEEATVVRSEPRKCNFFPGKSFFSLLTFYLYVLSSCLSFIHYLSTLSYTAFYTFRRESSIGLQPIAFSSALSSALPWLC
jgi:hypothetical protein